MKPCVFFDRDGIVNEPPPEEKRYVLHEDDLHLIPEFLRALRIATDKGYAAVIVTNQKCIASGLMTNADLDRIHDHLRGLLRAAGLAVTGIYVSPHADDAHPDRKPNPGMLLRAAADHGLDLSRSWMIGDNEKDVMAGKKAGCFKTVRVKPGQVRTHADIHLQGMHELPGLLATQL